MIINENKKLKEEYQKLIVKNRELDDLNKRLYSEKSFLEDQYLCSQERNNSLQESIIDSNKKTKKLLIKKKSYKDLYLESKEVRFIIKLK